jgi:hypothetical protein
VEPQISVLIAADHQGAHLAATLRSAAGARTAGTTIEFVIVGCLPVHGTVAALRNVEPELRNKGVELAISEPAGEQSTTEALNQAVSFARGPVIVTTGGNVRFSAGWDALIGEHLTRGRVLTGTISEAHTLFVGYGARLTVPLMGMSWQTRPVDRPSPVPIGASRAMAMHRDTFNDIGGYEQGMLLPGAAEPEFSVRAWLRGLEVFLVPSWEIRCGFSLPGERPESSIDPRSRRIHDQLRFGLLYLSEPGAMQLLRYCSITCGAQFQDALKLVAASDVWRRRDELEARQQRPFSWFADHFGL